MNRINQGKAHPRKAPTPCYHKNQKPGQCNPLVTILEPSFSEAELPKNRKNTRAGYRKIIILKTSARETKKCHEVVF
ncbi:hypothetical protein BDV10DRAFT_105090 [Aspergillus recurvatus]